MIRDGSILCGLVPYVMSGTIITAVQIHLQLYEQTLTLFPLLWCCGVRWRLQAVCTEAGMFALRERRIHVTQEDFEMSVAKVMKKDSDMNMSIRKLWK